MQNKFFLAFLLTCVSLFCSVFVYSQQNPRNVEVNWTTQKNKHIVPLDEFLTLLPRDGIPPIDQPVFWKKEQAFAAFFEHEPVISVEIKGQAKAYPLSVLMFHEIVNDELGELPISATYCPLCNAAIVFDRRLEFEGRTYLLDFGVSGMLRKSDLVMWDRQTESWWQQFTGEALVGLLAGANLEFIPSMLISLKDFFLSYPDGQVLSTETGHFREYGSNPYNGYDNLENEQPRFFHDQVDQRLPAMERIIDIYVKGSYKIYPVSVIQEEKVINDRFNDKPVVLFFDSKTVSVLDEKMISESRQIGSVTVFSPVVNDQELVFQKIEQGFRDIPTGSVWSITGKCVEGRLKGLELEPINHGNHFAFAWFAFHPESEIYGQP